MEALKQEDQERFVQAAGGVPFNVNPAEWNEIEKAEWAKRTSSVEKTNHEAKMDEMNLYSVLNPVHRLHEAMAKMAIHTEAKQMLHEKQVECARAIAVEKNVMKWMQNVSISEMRASE